MLLFLVRNLVNSKSIGKRVIRSAPMGVDFSFSVMLRLTRASNQRRRNRLRPIFVTAAARAEAENSKLYESKTLP